MAGSHKIDIAGLLSGSRQVLLVDEEVPIEPFEGIAFPRGARVRLELRRTDRMLTIAGGIDAQACGQCDACLEDVNTMIHVDVDERLDPSTDARDDPFGESNVLMGDRLDIADLAQQLILSALPMGVRCSQGCAGLCGTCGANRNTGDCSCQNGEIDGELKMENPAQ